MGRLLTAVYVIWLFTTTTYTDWYIAWPVVLEDAFHHLWRREYYECEPYDQMLGAFSYLSSFPFLTTPVFTYTTA